MGVAGKEKEAATKQEQQEKASANFQTVRTEYEAMSEQLISEFATFKRQKSEDLRNIMLKFTMIQARHRTVCDIMSMCLYDRISCQCVCMIGYRVNVSVW